MATAEPRQLFHGLTACPGGEGSAAPAEEYVFDAEFDRS